jgi:hypothetical protein
MLTGKVGGNHHEGKNFYSKPGLRLLQCLWMLFYWDSPCLPGY